MIVLGIETSCDETAIAIIKDGKVYSSKISSSVHLHANYGGVIPEIASRYHTEYISSVYKEALVEADIRQEEIDLIAVSNGPGLSGSLLVGVSFAKAIAFSLNKPIIGINHVHAHLFSPLLNFEEKIIESLFPMIGVVISGGHTSIYNYAGINNISVIGRTKDDAIGEAYDKVSKIMGLGYPGGPIIEKRALECENVKGLTFPKALLKEEDGLDFSFSGVKTSVLYYWKKCKKTEEDKNMIAFAFQESIIEVIEAKVNKAIEDSGYKVLVCGGGVINNSKIRDKFIQIGIEKNIKILLPDVEYCGDNAAMIAGLGEKLFSLGVSSDLYLKIEPVVN